MPITSTPRFRDYVKLVQKRLPEKKAMHCIFVAEYFASFATKIEVDHDKAVLAGLLHDICRTLEQDDLNLHAARGAPVEQHAGPRREVGGSALEPLDLVRVVPGLVGELAVDQLGRKRERGGGEENECEAAHEASSVGPVRSQDKRPRPRLRNVRVPLGAASYRQRDPSAPWPGTYVPSGAFVGSARYASCARDTSARATGSAE